MNVDGFILATLVVTGIYTVGFICGYVVCKIFAKKINGGKNEK